MLREMCRVVLVVAVVSVVSGGPLLLTPLLQDGSKDVARTASQVFLPGTNVTSYSGFFTVDQEADSNMFFWYFPAEEKPETAPVIVWLQGGPGVSSLYAVFKEQGPFSLSQGKLVPRDVHWSREAHMIYLDNPVGTGFSFTNGAYTKDEETVGNNLYSALYQFFTLFEGLQQNELYISGESYAGKYVPAVSYKIHTNNPSAELKLNLKGMMIGDGLCDPINMMDYGDYLHHIGLLDKVQRDRFKEIEARTKALIRADKYKDAYFQYIKMMNGNGLFNKFTGFTNVYNYLQSQISMGNLFEDIDEFLSDEDVRERLHVGSVSFEGINPLVEAEMLPDFLHSVAPWVSTLVDNYRALFYNGQLDIVVAYPLTVNFLEQLSWCGAAEYQEASRRVWHVGREVAGYVRGAAPARCNGSITDVLVRNAGHVVPQDQPAWAYSLVMSFIRNTL